MNCINPCAPAALVWLLRPWRVSAIPIPANSTHGTRYRFPAATYKALMRAGMVWAGLVSDW